MNDGVTLRAETPEDEKFSYAVYASTREDELALTGWSNEQKAAFTRMQFEAQRSHYRKHFPACAFLVVQQKETPIGRLYVNRGAEISVVDIAILPAYRGSGIGGRLLRELQTEAARDGKNVGIYVEQFNRAQTLYRRLGFETVGVEGPYLRMTWKPETAVQEL